MNGGSAFPATAYDDNGQMSQGMSLRDYFAAKAMQATVQAWIARSIYPHTDDDVARNAYAIADSMLKERGNA